MVVNRITTMGGRAGGGARGGGPGGLGGRDTSYKGKIENVESLVHMKDPAMYKATKEAIARYAAVIGNIGEKNVKLADMSKSVYGVQMTDVATGKSTGIFLNKKYFNKSAAAMKAQELKDYKSGWSTKTNKPLAHTVTHELAHATWNTAMKGTKYQAAGKTIAKVYTAWQKSSKKSGYGKYASSNVNEWWAETVTKAVHGKSDRYTKSVKGIIKKYNL